MIKKIDFIFYRYTKYYHVSTVKVKAPQDSSNLRESLIFRICSKKKDSVIIETSSDRFI